MQKITHLEPTSVFYLFIPSLIATAVSLLANYLLDINQFNSSLQMLAFAAIPPITFVLIGLSAVAAVFIGGMSFCRSYNRFTAQRDKLLLESTADENGLTVTGIGTRSLVSILVPLLVGAAVFLASYLVMSVVITSVTIPLPASELGTDWISGFLQLFFIVLLIGTPIITLIILLSLLLASAVYNGVAGEGKGVSFRLREGEAGLVLNKISLRSIGYWLPSHLAVNVVSGLLAMLLGSMNLTSLLFSIGLSIPLLWLTAWLYNLFSGKGGITLRLSEEGE